jgi:hypothetical protein
MMPEGVQAAAPAGRERRADIDALRIGATYLLFVFHVLSATLQRELLASTGPRFAELPPLHESFTSFYPTCFTSLGFTWGHLWFVAYLCALSLAWLPLL